MKVALCQIDPTVGDFAGNRDKILRAAAAGRRRGARLAVFSELVVCGYPAEDLLQREDFLQAHDAALTELAAQLPPDLAVLVGCLERNPHHVAGGLPLYNAVALCEDGVAHVVARKSLLPTYDVFDEARYFAPWPRPEDNIAEIGGLRVGVTVCEDAWNDPGFHEQRSYASDPVGDLVAADIDLLVNVSASPWNRRSGPAPEGKEDFRLRMLRSICARYELRLLFVNQTGGDVGIQFDGGSAAIGPAGLAAQPVYFDESVQVAELDEPWTEQPEPQPLLSMQYRALVQGIRAYGHKFGMPSAVVGLSGGIDSALTATLAVDALGADDVTGIAMPSTHSSEHSLTDARELARNLGIRYHEIPIRGLQEAFAAALAEVFSGTEPGTAEENLQARARGTLLMAHANKFGGMLLTTGNKSEAAVGYCTLYGDMNGALAPIADLWKTEVWAMARWLNRDGVRIPVSSIEKPPSAELRPGQLDTDALPDYARLDPLLRELVEEQRGIDEVAERAELPRAEVQRLFRMVANTEFKRFQYAPTLRVSQRCWGGRRYPVSHRFTGGP